MEGPSHVVFGVAGAVALDSVLHLSGPALFGAQTAITPDQVGLKVIFYSFAALGALAPDIDNARSTLGKRLGPISRQIQKHAGHRTIFHSIVGLALVAALGWAVQQGVARLLLRVGWPHTAEALFANVALEALLVGYGLHIVADGLTLGGVPLLWPWHERFGFPPVRAWRFKTGSVWEPIVVVAVAVAVIVGIFTRVLAI
ncbi:MAG TPA: metal-dependent hydrolase [Ktedonobacterales bacterium]|nr:metal-dependent hydrolase [Ktedonobacterales bacterium]